MIFLDSDGLAANFHKRLENYIPWTLFKRLSKVDQADFLSYVYSKEPDFFLNLEPNQQFLDIIEWCEHSGERWGILTATGEDHHDLDMVKRHKLEWFDKHFNIVPDQITIVTKSSTKAKYAQTGYILVDDYDENCMAFSENGGMGIVVKANTYDSAEVISKLTELVEMKYAMEVACI